MTNFLLALALIFAGITFVWMLLQPMPAVAALMLTGCASVFDAPPVPLIEAQPVQYRFKNDTTPVLCEHTKDDGRWTMYVPRNQCEGWTPI